MIDIDVSKIVSEIGEPTARLIEDEEAKRHRVMTFVFCSVFLFILMISTLLFYVLNFNVKKASAKLVEDTKSLQEENARLVDIEKEATYLRQRNIDALSLITNNPNWSFVLEELEKVVPSRNIMFTGFDISSPEEMRISGVGSDYSSVSKLVLSMSEFTVKDKDGKDAKVFGNVRLESASLKNLKDVTSIDFSIRFGFIRKINKDSIVPLTSLPSASPTTTTPSTGGSESGTTSGPGQGSGTAQEPTTPVVTPPQNQGNSGLPVL